MGDATLAGRLASWAGTTRTRAAAALAHQAAGDPRPLWQLGVNAPPGSSSAYVAAFIAMHRLPD